MTDDLPLTGPACPDCQQELNVEIVDDEGVATIACTCPVDGVVSLADPFGER